MANLNKTTTKINCSSDITNQSINEPIHIRTSKPEQSSWPSSGSSLNFNLIIRKFKCKNSFKKIICKLTIEKKNIKTFYARVLKSFNKFLKNYGMSSGAGSGKKIPGAAVKQEGFETLRPTNLGPAKLVSIWQGGRKTNPRRCSQVNYL